MEEQDRTGQDSVAIELRHQIEMVWLLQDN